MHEVDDAAQPQLPHPRSDLIHPGPVELARSGLDEVPRDAPADELRSRGGGEIEIFAPMLVMLGELVLVELAVADPFLRDEGVFDPDSEVQAVLAVPRNVAHAASFPVVNGGTVRSEEHTSELQSLMR